jgi:hypothetical protein
VESYEAIFIFQGHRDHCMFLSVEQPRTSGADILCISDDGIVDSFDPKSGFMSNTVGALGAATT